MVVQLPDPPVPPDADLTHFDDMPLEVRRLRDSALAGAADAEGFRCAVLLWSTSWHQIPAGSLPNDDGDLCRLSGLGRDAKTWRKVRAVAMKHWALFNDGRLYHPVVTEKVIGAWNSTRVNRWAKECDRIRKENKARASRKENLLEFPPKPPPIPYIWPKDIRRNSDGTAMESGLNRMEWKGRESQKGEPIKGLPPDETQPSPPIAEGALPLRARPSITPNLKRMPSDG